MFRTRECDLDREDFVRVILGSESVILTEKVLQRSNLYKNLSRGFSINERMEILRNPFGPTQTWVIKPLLPCCEVRAGDVVQIDVADVSLEAYVSMKSEHSLFLRVLLKTLRFHFLTKAELVDCCQWIARLLCVLGRWVASPWDLLCLLSSGRKSTILSTFIRACKFWEEMAVVSSLLFLTVTSCIHTHEIGGREQKIYIYVYI